MTFLGLRWPGIFDFVILVAAIYFVLRWSRQARALRVTLGILALEAGALIARHVHLTITVWVLHAGTIVAAVMLATNKIVREILMELLETAKALARDLRDEGI